MADKFDVEIHNHEALPNSEATECVKFVLAKAKEYYGRLLPTVEKDDREPSVRERLLFEHENLRQFSRDHPRLFGLASSEMMLTDSSKREHLFVLLYVSGLVESGEIPKNQAHDKFVQLTMEVAKK